MRSLNVLVSLLALLVVFQGSSASEPPFAAEKVVLFPKNGARGLEIEAGPVTLQGLTVRNMPDAEDLEKGKSDPKEKWRPRLSVTYSNSGNEKMKVFFKVTLEDKQGNVYFTCETDDTISGGAVEDHSSLCMMASMKMQDFHKVTHVRFIIRVQPD
jgi:hypothetical protein